MSQTDHTQIPGLSREAADALRYATTVVTIGPNPDQPGQVVMAAYALRDNGRGTPPCLLLQAHALTNLAAYLESLHTPGSCS